MEMSFDRWLGILGVLGIFIGVGVAIAMDPKSKGELVFAISCFIFSGVALCFSVGIWGFFTSKFSFSRVLISGALFAVICVSMVGASRWANGRYRRTRSNGGEETHSITAQVGAQAQPSQGKHGAVDSVKAIPQRHGTEDSANVTPNHLTSAESIRPHLQTRLVIDSVPQGADVEFHIEVENISKLQVNGLRAGMRTPEMTSHDVSMPLPPTLPPGGRLSIPGNPVSGLKRHGVLFLDLSYESKVDGKANKSISSYSFLVRPVDMKPQSLLPTTWQEQAGVILGPEQETMEAALKTLAGPQGTMLIGLPLLRPDGSPNLLVMTNNKRKFSFDGGSRSISFTTITNTGSLRTIKHALPDGSYQAIVIGCLWDDQKDEAKLIINGNEFP